MQMQWLVASSNLAINLFFFYSFINETRFTYGRNTVIGIGEGVAEFGLIAADFFGTITAHSTF